MNQRRDRHSHSRSYSRSRTRRRTRGGIPLLAIGLALGSAAVLTAPPLLGAARAQSASSPPPAPLGTETTPIIVAPAPAPAPGPRPPANTSPAVGAVVDVPEGAKVTAPATGADGQWHTTFYGFAELNGMHDSTGSYGAAANNAMLARPGTYAGMNGRGQMTANNSQVGVVAVAPAFRCIRTTGQVEMDFFGIQPTDATEQTIYTLGSPRMRLFYVKLETPVVDVLAGQFHDLFGWGGAGFYPNSVAFLGLPGEIYHRQPQLRVSKTLGQRVQLELAAAAVRPVQRDGEVPDLQAGVKLLVNHRRGFGAQGFGRPDRLPLALGLSGVGRRFAVAEFLTAPGGPRVTYGWGLAANVFLPVLQGRSATDRGNALSITAEATIGSGISDLYTQLTGGALFPTLSNPGSIVPPPLYKPNIDNGIVTYDGNGDLKTIDWRALVIGLQYYLPVADGRVWVSGTFSLLASGNLAALTPSASQGGIFIRQDYVDANLFFAITPAVHVGLSYQTTHQTFGDHPFRPDPGMTMMGVQAVNADARNHRGEGAVRFYF